MPRTEGGGEEGPERLTLQLNGAMAEGEEIIKLRYLLNVSKCSKWYNFFNKYNSLNNKIVKYYKILQNKIPLYYNISTEPRGAKYHT